MGAQTFHPLGVSIMLFNSLAFLMLHASALGLAHHTSGTENEGAFLAKQVRKPEQSAGDWHDMTCFMDLSRDGRKPNDVSIVSRSGNASASGDAHEVLVVQDSPRSGVTRRTLVFRTADGKCNEQAGTLCANIRTFADGEGLSGSFSTDAALLGASVEDKCSSQECTADVDSSLREPGASYLRSMAATLSMLPAAAGQKDGMQRIVMVGLGAGTLPMLLHQVFPNSRQTVVELSAQVVQSADCFGAGGNSFEVVTADGRRFLEQQAAGSIDAVLIDAFDAEDRVPQCFTTSDFFQTARRVLKPGGVLALNAHTGTTLHNDLRDLLPAAQSVFGTTAWTSTRARQHDCSRCCR